MDVLALATTKKGVRRIMNIIRVITTFFLGIAFASLAMLWMNTTFPPDRFVSMRQYDDIFILMHFLIYPLGWVSADACVDRIFARPKRCERDGTSGPPLPHLSDESFAETAKRNFQRSLILPAVTLAVGAMLFFACYVDKILSGRLNNSHVSLMFLALILFLSSIYGFIQCFKQQKANNT